MASRLQPWYKVVVPREDLRDGRPLDAAEFAVHLDHVRAGDAPPDYQEPQRFFERTYLTKSLAGFAGEVSRRLSGETVETSAVFNLATQFGGGKTHALTLLYHLAKLGPAASDLPGVSEALRSANVPPMPRAAVAVFVGTEFDVITGRGGRNGAPRRRTPWGELAYQLGGAEAYRHVAEHEKDPVTAPSCEVIRSFLPTDRPCLILIDELINYVSRGRPRGLAAQVYSFLQNLSEEARRQRNVVLAVSVPASELEMSEADHADFERLRKLLDKLGKSVAMAEGVETSEIIRRRLFEWEGLPQEAFRTAGAYAKWVQDHRRQLPEWFPADRAAEEFTDTYPFHPSLISVFERKWQTLPRFQRTRGILRLLALWVSKAYERGYRGRHVDPLIGTGTAPLDDPLFRRALFQQLGSDELEAAVTTDICGASDAHALRLDDEAQETIRRARLHEKVAITAFFESNGGQTKDYATEPEIRLAVCEPDLDIGNVETVLSELTERCYYLTADNRRYRFSQQPNLNKLLADRRASIAEAAAAERVREEVREAFRRDERVALVFFPEQSSQIPDQPALTFVVVAPDAVATDPTAPEVWLRKMTMEYGTSARRFKSALIWCVPDPTPKPADEARRVLAWEAIELEREALWLDAAGQQQLRESLDRARRSLREAVWATYRNVWLLGRDNEMRRRDLGLVHSSAARSLTDLILLRLRADGEVEESISPSFLVRSGNWPPAFEERGWPTRALRDAFFAAPQFPRLLNGDSIRETIARGVGSKLFAYAGVGEGDTYHPFLYGEPLTANDVEISDEVVILRSEAAEAYLRRIATPDDAVTDRKGGAEETGTKDIGPEPGTGPPAPGSAETVPGERVGACLRWSGEVPWGKWAIFYREVLSRFAVGKGLEIRVDFTVRPGEGITAQQVSETRHALRDLELSDDVQTE